MGARDERRYSELEFRRIFEEATAERPADAASSGSHEGLTLSEIREIAREVGVDAAAIERAAERLEATGLVQLTSTGRRPFTRGFSAEAHLSRPLTDSQMRSVALEAERVLERRGTFRRGADVAEWDDGEKRVSVRIVRAGGATRVAVTVDQTPDLLMDSALVGGFGLLGAVVAGVSGVGLVVMLAPPILAATAGVIWLQAMGRGRASRELLAKVLDELLEVARVS